MEAALAIQPGLPKSPASGFKGKAAVQVHLPVGCQNCVMCSDLQYLDHVRVARVPACLWLIGGGAEGRSVMSLQNASRRRGAIEGTLQVKGHYTASGFTGGPGCFGSALGARQRPLLPGIHTSGRRPCCISRTRSGPEPPGYDRGTDTRGVRVALRWRGSRARTDTTHCPISRHQLQR